MTPHTAIENIVPPTAMAMTAGIEAKSKVLLWLNAAALKMMGGTRTARTKVVWKHRAIAMGACRELRYMEPMMGGTKTARGNIG